MKILICDSFTADLPERLQKFGEVSTDITELENANIVLVRSKTKCTKEFIDKAKNLRLIIRGGVGLDNIDCVYAKSKGILVENTANASSIAVAELTISLMLSITHQIVKTHLGMKENKWLKKQAKRVELYQKKIALIGLGRIGLEVAKRVQAFGMSVVAYDPYISECENNEIELKSNLAETLSGADFISIHTPLTDETRHIINKKSLEWFKNGAILINTARGECIIEEDVAQALETGKLGGFGNDVWYSDPPKNSPLIHAPNVVLTPHIGGSTKENLQRISDLIIKRLA